MGLLNFTRRSRKHYQSKKPNSNDDQFESTQRIPSNDDNNSTSFPLPSTSRKLSLGNSVPKETETSLMDDIMSELSSTKSVASNKFHGSPLARYDKVIKPQPLLAFDIQASESVQATSSSSSSSSYSATIISPAFPNIKQHAIDNNRVSCNSMQRLSNPKPKPKPLISFSEVIKPARDNKNLMHGDSIPSTNDSDSKYPDADNQPVRSRSTLHLQNANNRLSTSAEMIADSSRKLATPLPSSPSATSSKPSTPPTSNRISITPADTTLPSTTSKNLMDRMKERHRLEVRRSLNTSPFLGNAKTSSSNLSSPSMPIIFSAPIADHQSSHFDNNGTGGVHQSQRPLVQSQSFTTYVKPINPSSASPKRQSGHLVRSMSIANDIYGNSSIKPTTSTSNIITGSNPIQTQSDNTFLRRYTSPQQQSVLNSQSSASANGRNSYIPNVKTHSSQLTPFQQQESVEPSNNIQEADAPANPMHLQLNRSVSAYPSFPQQSLQQQLQYHQQQQQQTQLQQQLILQQQQIQQQQIQQQIELQQQQLQEQQMQQQQKLQQLQLQQQKQRMINRTLLETSMSTPLLGSSHKDTSKSAIRSDKNSKRMSNTINRAEARNEIAFKSHVISRPLYERSSSPLTEKQETYSHQCNNGSRHLSQRNLSGEHRRHHRFSHINTNNVSLNNSSDVPDTPPPENHFTLLREHLSVDSKEKDQRETQLTQLQSVSEAKHFENKDASACQEGISIENIFHANSSTSTLAEESMNEKEEKKANFDISKVCQPIKLPQKLKRELQNMQLRRSPYSAPDLSTFLEDGDTTERELRNIEKSWDEVQLFTGPSDAVMPIDADGLGRQKVQMPALDSAITIEDAKLKSEIRTPISLPMNALENDHNQEERNHCSTIKYYDSNYTSLVSEKGCCSSNHHFHEHQRCLCVRQPHPHQKGPDNRCTRKHEYCSSDKHHNNTSHKCSSSAPSNRCSNSNNIKKTFSAYSIEGCLIASNNHQHTTHHCHHNNKKHCKHNHQQHGHRCRKHRDSRSKYTMVEDMRL